MKNKMHRWNRDRSKDKGHVHPDSEWPHVECRAGSREVRVETRATAKTLHEGGVANGHGEPLKVLKRYFSL